MQLAQGEAKLRQDPVTGTLLTVEPTQAIIPLGKIVNLGYCGGLPVGSSGVGSPGDA